MKILYVLLFSFIIKNQVKRGVLNLYIYYARLCAGRFTKEQTDSFFRRALYKGNHENIIASVLSFIFLN